MAYISFEQILRMPQFRKARVMGGMRADAHVIKCGHVIELPDVEKWIDGGELLFMTGVGLKDVEEDLRRIVQSISRKGAAGLVLETGPYIEEVPESVISLCEELKVPLVTLPFETRLNDIMTGIYKMYYEILLDNDSVETVLKKILYYEYDDSVLAGAVHLGYDPELSYRSAVIQPDSISDRYNNAELSYTIAHYFSCLLPPEHRHFFLSDGNCSIVMLPSVRETEKEKLPGLLTGLQQKILQQYPGMTVSIGLGEEFQKLRDFKRSTTEAKNAIKLLQACRRTNAIRFYQDIGIYRLFFNMEDREEMVQMLHQYLGELLRYDEENGTSLVDTLEVYLKNGMNIGLSAEQLYIHRNTLKYRVQKAQAILHADFKDTNDCFNIRLAYKIKRFLYDIRALE